MAAATAAGASPGGAVGAPEEAGTQPSQELRCVSGEAEAGEWGWRMGWGSVAQEAAMGELERGGAGKGTWAVSSQGDSSMLSDQEAQEPGYSPWHVPI